MTNRAKDVLSLVLILVSLAVLGTAYAYSRRPAPPLPAMQPLAVADDIAVGIEELLAPAHFSFGSGVPDPGPAEVLAVFLLRPTVCPACLSEVQDYVAVIDQINQQGREVMPLALVFTGDPTQARHFIRTTALPIPVGYGDPVELATRLGHRDGETVLQQLVFIDTAEEVLFYRVMLPNTVTAAGEKAQLLERILATRPPERLRPLAIFNHLKGGSS